MATAALTSNLQLQRGAFSSRAAPRRSAALRAPLSVRADAAPAVKPPQGATLPPVKPAAPASNFGFVDNAETLNSRAAMIGFFALLLVELVAGQGILNLVGFTTGKGLGFEF